MSERKNSPRCSPLPARSATGPVCRSLPRWRIANVEQISSATSRIWVERKIVLPLLTYCTRNSFTTSCMMGSKLMRGSSMRAKTGSWMKAWANISFCRVPRDRSLQRTSFLSPNSRKSNHHSAFAARSGILRTAPTNSRYSTAVRKLGGDSCSGIIPTRSRTLIPSFSTSSPSTVADPPVGRTCPVSTLIMVVFPDPFGPRRPKSSPAFTVRETWSTAQTSPYAFERSLVSSTAAILYSVPGPVQSLITSHWVSSVKEEIVSNRPQDAYLHGSLMRSSSMVSAAY